jgi:glucan phosphoethanolaminetransferase (alkaline phosphatase superfamily)
MIVIIGCGGSENPNEPISTKATINISLIVIAILLFFALGLFKGVPRLLVIIGIVAIVVSIIFYWRSGKFSTELNEIEIWVSSLDVALAHAVISFTLIVSLGLILLLPFSFIFGVVSSTSSSQSTGCLPLIAILLYIAGVIFSYKFLMIDTIDLQMILFNDFDKSLGWNFPTTFRFSNLINQINTLYAEASTNPEISPVLGSVTAALTFVLGLGGVFGIFELVKNIFKK